MPKLPNIRRSSVAVGGSRHQVVDSNDQSTDGAEEGDSKGTSFGQSFRPFAGFVSWSMLAVVVVVVFLRATDVSSVLLIAIVGATTFAAIPLLIAVVGSLIHKSLTLRLATGLVAVVFFFVTTPLDAVIGCRPSDSDETVTGDSASAQELTILTANVLWTTGRPDLLSEMIVESEADIVSLQEVSAGLFETLSADPALTHYSYKDFDTTSAPFATATLSKLPTSPRDAPRFNRRITETEFPDSGTNPIKAPFTVTSLHLSAPQSPMTVPEWKDQLGYLDTLPTDKPAILVGDFNATEDHKPFRKLLGAGWTDVHQKKGCGLDATFPSRERFPVAVMRLDHILVTDHFETMSVDVLSPRNGSDHNPVLAKIRLDASAALGG